MKLYIGNKNYSSWSLRPWLLMKALDIPFEERFEPFTKPDNYEDFRKFSPTGQVPLLIEIKSKREVRYAPLCFAVRRALDRGLSLGYLDAKFTDDFVTAARLDGVSEGRIIFRHMLPSFSSHIIASVTLAVPAMILAETALSFLGLGLQPPVISWCSRAI